MKKLENLRRDEEYSRAWWTGAGRLPVSIWASVLLLSVLLRFVALDIKPSHFDEGVNGWFMERMKSSVVYDYDHQNYHGPLHFYVGFPFVSVLGNSDTALRLPAVLFSVASTALLLSSSTVFGRLPSLLMSVFFTTSVGSVFYSRYGIHESALAFFVTLFAVALLKLRQTGTHFWMTCAVVALTGGILTKETFFINMLTLPMAVFSVAALDNIVSRPKRKNLAPTKRQAWSWYFLLTITFFAVIIVELFYNSFGNKPGSGWGDFLRSYAVWSETGTKGAGHIKTDYDILGFLNYYWLALIARYEWPFLVAAVSALIYWRIIGTIGHVGIFWATGTIVAYSLIPYKTPWCILSMLPSMAIVVGIFLSTPFLSFKSVRLGVVASLVLVASPLPYTLHLNFKDFDNPKEPYVYVQTSREALRFLGDLQNATAQDPRFYDVAGLISLDSYYPLPWWLSKYSRVEYGSNQSSLLSPDKYWALISWKNLPGFLEKNSDRAWRHYRFKLRDAQEDVVAVFDKRVFPEGSPPVFPAAAEE